MKAILLILFVLASNYILGQTDINELQRLYDNKNYKEAIDLGTALAVKYKSTDSLYKKIIGIRSGCYMTLYDFDNAIVDLKVLLKADTNDIRYIVNVSNAYWGLYDKDSCLKYAYNAHRIKPDEGWTLSNLSYFNSGFGNYQEGLKFANMGLQKEELDNMGRATLLNNRGFAYIGLKKYSIALVDINQSITLNPQNSFAFYYRALANIALNKMATVCEDLEMSKQLGGIYMTKDLIHEYCEK